MTKQIEYEVVWSGRDSLLPDREEHWDSRYAGMPDLDLDEGEKAVEVKRRQYNRTGKHTGVFSRTDPSAKHYKPTVRVLNCKHRFDYTKDRKNMRCRLCGTMG